MVLRYTRPPRHPGVGVLPKCCCGRMERAGFSRFHSEKPSQSKESAGFCRFHSEKPSRGPLRRRPRACRRERADPKKEGEDGVRPSRPLPSLAKSVMGGVPVSSVLFPTIPKAYISKSVDSSRSTDVDLCRRNSCCPPVAFDLARRPLRDGEYSLYSGPVCLLCFFFLRVLTWRLGRGPKKRKSISIDCGVADRVR